MLCQALVREPGEFSEASLYKIEVFFFIPFLLPVGGVVFAST